MLVRNILTPRTGELYSHTAIRGVAALCVVGYHAVLGSAGKGYTDNVIQNYFLTSFIFVDFFFMLSGFIMSESYGKKLTRPSVAISSIEYWKKRLLKILPNYYFWLIVAIALTFLRWSYFGNSNVSNICLSNSLFKHFLFIQNIAGSCHYFNTPLWSIAVELMAYFAFPFIVLLRIGRYLTITIAIIFYIILFRYSETIDVIDGYYSIIRCFAGFLCGIAAAKFSKDDWPDIAQLIIVALLICAIALNYQVAALILMFLVTIVTAQNTGIIAKSSQMSLPYLLGRSSFSIYLAHVPVGMVVSTVAYKIESETGISIGSDWRVIMPLEILATCIIGIFAYAFVELRFEAFFNRRKRHPQII